LDKVTAAARSPSNFKNMQSGVGQMEPAAAGMGPNSLDAAWSEGRPLLGRDDGSNPLIERSRAGDSSERADLLMIHLRGIGEQRGMGAMLHWILPRLAAYVAVVVAAGLLFLAGASVYALMWPKPVVPFGQMSR
jgi:hypothetical protein